MHYEAPHALEPVSLRLDAEDARAVRRCADLAYDDLGPKIRAGQARFSTRQLVWAWQAATLLDIDSGCAAGRTLPGAEYDDLYEEGRYDSLPLPIWQWKLVWMLFGYGLHLGWAKHDEIGARLWKGICYHLSFPESDEDHAFAVRRYDAYLAWEEDLERGTVFLERLEEMIRLVVGERTPDVHRGSPWIPDPVPLA